MPWNEATQGEYKRNRKELETTLTDNEWKLIEPLLPAPFPKGRPPDNRSRTDKNDFVGASGPVGIQRDSVHPRTDSSGRDRMLVAGTS